MTKDLSKVGLCKNVKKFLNKLKQITNECRRKRTLAREQSH